MCYRLPACHPRPGWQHTHPHSWWRAGPPHTPAAPAQSAWTRVQQRSGERCHPSRPLHRHVGAEVAEPRDGLCRGQPGSTLGVGDCKNTQVPNPSKSIEHTSASNRCDGQWSSTTPRRRHNVGGELARLLSSPAAAPTVPALDRGCQQRSEALQVFVHVEVAAARQQVEAPQVAPGGRQPQRPRRRAGHPAPPIGVLHRGAGRPPPLRRPLPAAARPRRRWPASPPQPPCLARGSGWPPGARLARGSADLQRIKSMSRELEPASRVGAIRTQTPGQAQHLGCC